MFADKWYSRVSLDSAVHQTGNFKDSRSKLKCTVDSQMLNDKLLRSSCKLMMKRLPLN